MLDIPEDMVLRQIECNDATSKFSLGKEILTPLKIFLKKEAFDFHQYEIAKTFILTEERQLPGKIFAYITLMSSQIGLNQDSKPDESPTIGKYDVFPAVKIARLAVDKSVQGRGLGTILLDWCVSHIRLAIMPNIGCRFLVVDAKKDSIEFYQKAGFVLLDTETNHSAEHPLMFFDLYATERESIN